MKNNKFSKIAIAILTLALCIGAVFAMTVNAAGDTNTSAPKIISQNIKYGTDYRILYAVDSEGITGPVTLTVRNEENTIFYQGTVSETTYIKQLDKNVYKFTTNAISHLNMTDCFYVTASTEANGTSAPKRYSVAEYLYQRLSDPTASDAQIKLYERTIAYGESLQLVVGELDAEKDADKLISNLRYVTVEGGKLADGYSAGVYPVGTALTPTGDGVDAWTVYTYSAKGVKLDTSKKVTSYEIPSTQDLAHVRFCFEIGPDDLEGYADWSEVQNALISTTSAATGSLVSDAEKGNVGKVAFSAAGGFLRFNKFNTGVAPTAATAFVASFDLKIDAASRPEEDAAKSASIDLKFRDSGKNQWMRIQLQVIKQGATTQIGLGHDSNWATTDKWYTVETTDWLNVKVMQYEGNKNVYLYVEGDTENPITLVNQNTTASNSGYTIDDLSFVDIGWGNNMKGIDVYFDNVFFGFTEDLDPTIKKTPDTLESYTDWSDAQSALIYATSGSPSVEIVDDAEKGNVGKYTLKSGSEVSFNSFNTGVSSTEATAFIASFNLKVDTTNRTETNSGGSINFALRVPSDSSYSQYMRIQLQVIKDGTTSKFGVGTEGAFAGTFCDVITTDWFEVKIVQYKGESTKFHVYVNGTKLCELNDNGNANRKNVVDNYDENLYVSFAPGNFVTNIDFYFDDVFFGYTTDTNPDAAQ